MHLFFQKMGPPHSHNVFSTVCDTFKKKKNPGAHFWVIWEVKMGPGHVRGSRKAILGRQVCCLCLWYCLSAETAMACQVRVNDVFSAVSLSGTTTASSSTSASPAWSRSSGCPCQRLPSFQWRTVAVRSGPFRTQRACKHLGFETHDAVVHGFGVLCVVVRRCAIITIFLQKEGSTFHQKLMTVLGAPSPFDDSWEKKPSMPRTHAKREPKTQRASASRTHCSLVPKRTHFFASHALPNVPCSISSIWC